MWGLSFFIFACFSLICCVAYMVHRSNVHHREWVKRIEEEEYLHNEFMAVERIKQQIKLHEEELMLRAMEYDEIMVAEEVMENLERERRHVQ